MPLFRRVQPPFGLKTLQKDSNCVLIQDPSAIWGGSDHLPRRNLRTYSEDFSNVVWSKTNVTSTANTADTLDPNGTNTATKFAATGDVGFGTAQLNGVTTVSGSQYVVKTRLKAVDCAWVVLQVSDGGSTDRTRVWFNIATGAKGGSAVTGGGIVIDYGIASLGSDWYEVYTKVTNPITSTFIYFWPVSGDSSLTAVTKSWYSMGFMFCAASTTDQSYQRITDWVSEQYAWAATKNVPCLRRNMLTYSEDFSNAVWNNANVSVSANQTTAPDGTNTADLIYPATTGAYRDRTQNVTASSGLYIASVYVKAGGFTWALMRVMPASSAGAYFDLQNGVVGTVASGYSATITSVGLGWYKCTLSNTSPVSNPWVTIGPCDGNGNTTATANVTNGIYAWGAQLSVGTCDYQRIATTWAAEYTSLALAAGYPISLYSDRAGTTATVGPDDPVGVLLDQSEGLYGPELITNGTFPTNADGWTASANATVAWSSGKLQLSAAAAYPKVTQPITLSVGKYYEIIVDLEYVDAPLWVMVSSADTLTPDRQFSVIQYTSSTKFSLVFKSTIATAYVGVSLETTSVGKLGYIDNVSVREVLGYTAVAPSDAARPNLRLDGNGKWYLDRDTTDDNLPITWPTVLSDSQLGIENNADPTLSIPAIWELTSGWSIANNTLSRTDLSGNTIAYGITNTALKAYTPYLVSLEINQTSTGFTQVRISGTTTNCTLAATSGFVKYTLLMTTTASSLSSFGVITSGATAQFRNISIKEVTGTNVVYTATGDYTTKDSGLILSGATDYKYPQRPSGDYGRIVMAAESRYDAKIIKYLNAKRGRSYLLGPELVTNGGFDLDTAWSKSVGHSITGGKMVCTSVGAYDVFYQQISCTSGKTYVVSYDAVVTAGSIYAVLDSAANGNIYQTLQTTTTGKYTFLLACDYTTPSIFLRSGASGFTGSIDNVSVREILL